MGIKISKNTSSISPLTASFPLEEEMFTIVNEEEGYYITLIFEKKSLYSRCTLRYVSTKEEKAAVMQSQNFKFMIKSTFAKSPYGEEAVTFSHEELTASAISKEKGIIHLIAIAPSIILPDGTKGLKFELTIKRRKGDESFNSFSDKEKTDYAYHASIFESVEGTIRKGEGKEEISHTSYAIRVWQKRGGKMKKENSFALLFSKREYPSLIISSLRNNLVAIIKDGIFSFYEDPLTFSREEDGTLIIYGNNNFRAKGKSYGIVKEKKGPFHNARTIGFLTIYYSVGEETGFTEAFGFASLSSKKKF